MKHSGMTSASGALKPLACPVTNTSQISALSNISITLGGHGGGGTGAVNTTWASPAYPTLTNTNCSISNSNLTVERSGKLHLAGSDPDVIIGDISLKETLAGIQQQLGILQSNKGLEERWEKLRKIK